MKIKRLIKYYILGESLKEIEMNRILEKISNKGQLKKRENDFLNFYNKTTDEEKGRDLMYLSKSVIVKKVKDLISKGKKVFCDLHDRNGKIGLQIIDIIDEDNEDETSLIIMRGDERHKLHDKFLYNIIYNTKKDEYSLQEQDEYFEKITVKNED